MATAPIRTVLEHLRKAVLTGKGGNLTDAQLLECYLTRRDEAAFEALVRRHGSMVLGVCRRVLGNAHDAEDAFQATFLVLVRKAASIRPRERVGNWLHGVAYRTALKAKSAASRRQAREAVVSRSEAVPPTQPDDWQAVLDQEIQRLPEKYRASLVLCDLEGKTHKEAARQLGWAEGTLSTRLTRARKMLVEHLSKRGVTVSAVGLTAAVAEHSAAAFVPPGLVAATVQVQRLIGLASGAGAIPPTIAALTEGVMKSMAMIKVKKVLAIALIALSTIGFGIGGYSQLPAEEPTAAEDLPRGKALAEVKPLSVPSGPMLQPVLASLDSQGKVVIKRGLHYYEPVGGPGIPSGYRHAISVQIQIYDRATVRVFDSRGHRVEARKLPRLLKKEIVAFIVHGRDEPDPMGFQLLKEGTLVLQVPTVAVVPPPAPLAGPAPIAPPAVAVPAPLAPQAPPAPPPAIAPPPPAQAVPIQVEDRVQHLLQRYRDLMKSGKFLEARMAALKAKELDPNSVAADAAIRMADELVASEKRLRPERQVVFFAGSPRPERYKEVFDKVLEIVGEYFEIEDANRFDGRIQTVPRLGVPAKFLAVDMWGKQSLPTGQERRRRASVQIQAADVGGYFVQVQVPIEAKKVSAAGKESDWSQIGRHTELEQVILRRLAEQARLLAPLPRPAPAVPLHVGSSAVFLPPNTDAAPAPLYSSQAAPVERQKLEPAPSTAPKRPAPIVVRAGDFEIIGNSMVSNSTTQIDVKLFSLCGDVEVSHSPTNRPNVETDRSQPPKDGFFLRCDRLTFDRKKPGLARLQAEGKVVFRSDVFLARCSTLKYDQFIQQIALEGAKNNPARLVLHAETGRPPREITGTRILYNRRTGEIKVEGAQSSAPLPGGQLHESQAERDFETAEYYRRTGHPSSARFYYSLVCRRYPSSSQADSALRMLRDTEPKLKGARVGQVIIRGNDKVPDHVIREKLGVYPGEVLIYEDLRAAEKALAETGLFNLDRERGFRPAVTVLESDNEYKDILIAVQEK